MQSQFKGLVKRVERLETSVNGGGKQGQMRNKQREIEALAEQFKQAQQISKAMLADSTATPEQLEVALPFLTSPGQRAFAELEIEKKRTERIIAEQLADTVKTFEPNGQLIQNMKRAAVEGYYDSIRESLAGGNQQVQAPIAAVPETKQSVQPKPSMNAQRAANTLAARQWKRTVETMEPYRGPLGTAPRQDIDAMWPNPVNGVVA